MNQAGVSRLTFNIFSNIHDVDETVWLGSGHEEWDDGSQNRCNLLKLSSAIVSPVGLKWLLGPDRYFPPT